jgi:hypothetical protein
VFYGKDQKLPEVWKEMITLQTGFLIFQEGKLIGLAYRGTSGYNIIKPEQLTQSGYAMPVYNVSFLGLLDIPVPASTSPIALEPGKLDNITCVYTDVANIPDIGTENGSGISYKAAVKDIYDHNHDITDPVINNPIGELISVKLAVINNTVYNGKVQRPQLVVDGNTLVEGEDYKLIFTDESNEYIDAKDYIVVVEGIGAYAENVTDTYTIAKASIKDTKILGIGDVVFDGNPAEPKPAVMLGDVTLKEGVDYTLSYKNNTKIGKATLTVTGTGNLKDSVDVDFEITDGTIFSMYRMYNPNSGEHFYTGSTEERDSLIQAGWKNEGVGFSAPAKSDFPMYRLYNPNAGDHHYTGSEKEKEDLVKAGWKYEGIAFYACDNDGAPQFRLYNPNAQAGAHHYTSSAEERANLEAAGWKYEGIGFYTKK